MRLTACQTSGADEGCCRVEVEHNGEWGTLCDDNEDSDLVAKVICRHMGCSEDSLANVKGFEEFGGELNGVEHIWLDDIDCVGDEDHLMDCHMNEKDGEPWFGAGDDDCGHSEDFGVCCIGCGGGECNGVEGAGESQSSSSSSGY